MKAATFLTLLGVLLARAAVPCDNDCRGLTCGEFAHRLSCGELSALGCDCSGCCSAPPPTSPPPPSCRRTHRNILQGILDDAEETAEARGLTVDNAFMATFVNLTCLNTTKDPCAMHVAEAYFDEVFGGLRIEHISAAQLGGIPRPVGIVGWVTWALWISIQGLQYVVVLSSLFMLIAAHMSVRERLADCLIEANGEVLLDRFVSATWAAQPSVLARAAPLFVYAFALGTGFVVWARRDITKDGFKEEAKAGKLPDPQIKHCCCSFWSKILGEKTLASELPLVGNLVTLHFYFARVALAASCVASIVSFEWSVCAFIFLIDLYLKRQTANGNAVLVVLIIVALLIYLFTPAGPDETISIPTASPTAAPTNAYGVHPPELPQLPLWKVVIYVHEQHKVVLVLLVLVIPCLGRGLERITDCIKRAVHGAVCGPDAARFAAPFAAIVSVMMAFCFIFTFFADFFFLPIGLTILILIKSVYRAGFWILERLEERGETPAIRGDGLGKWLKASAYVHSAIAAVGWLGSVGRFRFLGGPMHWRKANARFKETSNSTLAGGLACVWILVALSPGLVYHAWADAHRLSNDTHSSWADHVSMGYRNTFDVIYTFHFDWTALIPDWQALLDVLADPLAALGDWVNRVGNLLEYIEFDPAYYLAASAHLLTLNVALNVLKFAATLLRTLWGLIDFLRGDDDDGIIQFHECYQSGTRAYQMLSDSMTMKNILYDEERHEAYKILDGPTRSHDVPRAGLQDLMRAYKMNVDDEEFLMTNIGLKIPEDDAGKFKWL